MRILILMVIMFFSPTLVAPTVPIELEEINKPTPKLSDHDQFLNDIGFRESGNRYTIVNQFGYMGKYQFGKATLRTLKIKVTKDAFLNSPDLQEYVMQQNLIYITESGILAAAHLAGPGSVRKFFRRGSEFKDGFGTSMTSYLKEFSGYNLNISL